jgi:hypothetical protein
MKKAPRVVLQLNLHRQFFLAVLDGSKTTEYRQRTIYWHRRLKGSRFTHFCFRNGYSGDAPEVLMEFVSISTRPRTGR